MSAETSLDVRLATIGFACCIMHQSGSLPQEPRGTGPVAVPAPRHGPGFTPHKGDMNNRGWRLDSRAAEGHRLAKVCLVKVCHRGLIKS